MMIRALLTHLALVCVADVATAETLALCSGKVRINCLVDGDTIWIEGEKLRMIGYDTPEPTTGVCGGEAEIALAHEATARALELLNTNPWSVDYSGDIDNTGTRELVTIRINGRDLGDILIEERLARSWPDGDKFWCNQ
jgi:micrococcal nuclease